MWRRYRGRIRFAVLAVPELLELLELAFELQFEQFCNFRTGSDGSVQACRTAGTARAITPLCHKCRGTVRAKM